MKIIPPPSFEADAARLTTKSPMPGAGFLDVQTGFNRTTPHLFEFAGNPANSANVERLSAITARRASAFRQNEGH